MTETGAQYVGIFDNIRFEGPDEILATGNAVGAYTSANDLPVERWFRIQREEGFVRLDWSPAMGVLEISERVDGPWTKMQNARPGDAFPIEPGTRFFRISN
jgi:hypothetical protein